MFIKHLKQSLENKLAQGQRQDPGLQAQSTTSSCMDRQLDSNQHGAPAGSVAQWITRLPTVER